MQCEEHLLQGHKVYTDVWRSFESRNSPAQFGMITFPRTFHSIHRRLFLDLARTVEVVGNIQTK